MSNRSGTAARDVAEALAIQALSFIAQDPERLGRFLAVTGIGPAEIRGAASESQFLAGVLDYVAGDERLLLDFATAAEIDPETVAKAQAALSGHWERDVP